MFDYPHLFMTIVVTLISLDLSSEDTTTKREAWTKVAIYFLTAGNWTVIAYSLGVFE